jgi:hypothetical protein
MTQVFTTGSGSSIIADAELGRGGEGIILEVRGDPTRCVKIYDGRIPDATLSKLSVMIAHPPLDPTLGNRHRSIAWPEQILFKGPGRTAFAGFVMPRVDNKVFRTALTYLSPDSRVKELGGRFNWRYLYTAATNVASSVGALHEKGYCIGDLNESNLLIASNALITIIDCDSFQVPDAATGRTYLCLVGKPEYTAPELQGRFGEIARTLATDRFALGVLLFQLLMEGTHPYQARGEAVEDLPSTQQKILRGLFPYARGVRGASPPAFAPPFDMLDPNLRKLFLRCFEAGHGDPSVRPSAEEWFDTLRNREYLLLTCPVNGNHVYFSHLKQCPWCTRFEVMRRDSFPNPLGSQTALPDPRTPLASVETRLGSLRDPIAVAVADGVVTSQESEYLINRGLEMQLTREQVEEVLEKEMRKTGAKRSAAVAPKRLLSKTTRGVQPYRHLLITRSASAGALFGLPLASVAAAKSLTQVAALFAVLCVTAACLSVNRKTGVAGLLWSVLLVLVVRYELLPTPLTSIFTWAVLFASADQMTSQWAYKLQVRGSPLRYPLLCACVLQTAIVFGFAYSPAVQSWILNLPEPATARPAPIPPRTFQVEVTGDSADLRSRPDLSAEILEPVPQGTVLEVDTTFGRWFRVKRSDPEVPGWVSQDLVRRLDAGLPPLSLLPAEAAGSEKTLRLPFKDDGACLAAKCVYGDWVASRRVVLHKAPDSTSPRVVTLHHGDVVRADTGIVLTWTSGKALVIEPLSFGTRRIQLGETVYPLHTTGEEQYRIWYRGQVHDVDKSGLVIHEPPKAVWWVRMTNIAGLTGWSAETGAFRKE